MSFVSKGSLSQSTLDFTTTDDVCHVAAIKLLPILRYSVEYIVYCAFDIFQKVDFCLTLYTEEVNLQNFVVI